jgi:CheY-like chemotaxis protein
MTELQGNPLTANIPTYAITGAAQPEDLQRGREMGFDDYLTKPLDVEQVMTIVRDRLSGH